MDIGIRCNVEPDELTKSDTDTEAGRIINLKTNLMNVNSIFFYQSMKKTFTVHRNGQVPVILLKCAGQTPLVATYLTGVSTLKGFF